MILMVQTVAEREPGVHGVERKVYIDGIDWVERCMSRPTKDVLAPLSTQEHVHIYGTTVDTGKASKAREINCFMRPGCGPTRTVVIGKNATAFLCNDEGKTVETIHI